MSTEGLLNHSPTPDFDPAYEQASMEHDTNGTDSSKAAESKSATATEMKRVNEGSTSISKVSKGGVTEAPCATDVSETGSCGASPSSSILSGAHMGSSFDTATFVESVDVRGKESKEQYLSMKPRQVSLSASLITDKRRNLISSVVAKRYRTSTWTSTSTPFNKDASNCSLVPGAKVSAPGQEDPTLRHEPTTSGNSKKPTEMCTVLLNGTVLRFTTVEGDSAWSEALGDSLRTRSTYTAGPKPITPLPDGQFYNIDSSGESNMTQAIYRKRDTHGVPVVFNTTIREVSFWDVNPNHFARDLRAVAGDEILSHRMTNYGALVLYVKSGEMAQELLKLTTVAGVPVTVHVPRDYSKNLGKIRTVPFHYTEANMVAVLSRYGVVAARRQVKNIRKNDGTNERITRSTVILTFRDDQQLPEHVRLGFLKFPVEPYVEAPVQCRHCQGFWHMSRVCHKAIRCRTCAGPHHHSACSYKQRPRCANCRGPHTAIHYRCPVRQEACRKKRFDLALQ